MDATQLGIGNLLTDHQEKDAIHVAIAPVVCDGPLKPGLHVGIIQEETSLLDYAVVGVMPLDKCIGIIDPFLTTKLKKETSVGYFYIQGQ